MSDICVNKIINDLETGAQYLVLWIAPGNDYGYWYDLNSSSRKPKRFETGNVLSIKTGLRYEISDFSLTDNRGESSITETEKAHRDRLWEMLRVPVECEPEIYEVKTRGEILRMTAEKHNVKMSNLYPLIDRYWRSGKTKNAFIPRYSNSGGKGKERKTYSNSVNRRTDDVTVGKTLTDTDRKHFWATVGKYYLKRTRACLKKHKPCAISTKALRKRDIQTT